MSSELISLLEREAQAERERLLEEARQRARDILQQAEAEAANLLEAHRRRVDAELEAVRIRAQGVAQLRATSLVLAAKDEQIAEVFQRARQELERLSRDPSRYEPVLRALLQEAVAGFRERVVVECAEQDLPLVQAAVQALGLAAEVRPNPELWGGVRVRSADGRFVVENTLLSRLERARQVLLSEVADILWGG
ncbi:MAG: V-type ATP synthase subunit E family protein [Armatimonadota bacterium]|nr:V-type ATP synthase subunit E family protein [Armatimonadota bacterium]MDR7439905.1 V-type ATP synthase subunit E family protein [Armatimonadota bacterium]MDR7562524.1 V-type ATP synthase subunit E family protein [Armatimonadota bacterium]MDR7568219.1 V-type ATP synthase subunit E family protein [Armatimonadota bacterium]MDR7601408.1 V-type ATP synthase subunit E family protein [Armatimonadota bacterium]